jgi:hypothetical protein
MFDVNSEPPTQSEIDSFLADLKRSQKRNARLARMIALFLFCVLFSLTTLMLWNRFSLNRNAIGIACGITAVVLVLVAISRSSLISFIVAIIVTFLGAYFASFSSLLDGYIFGSLYVSSICFSGFTYKTLSKDEQTEDQIECFDPVMETQLGLHERLNKAFLEVPALIEYRDKVAAMGRDLTMIEAELIIHESKTNPDWGKYTRSAWNNGKIYDLFNMKKF